VGVIDKAKNVRNSKHFLDPIFPSQFIEKCSKLYLDASPYIWWIVPFSLKRIQSWKKSQNSNMNKLINILVFQIEWMFKYYSNKIFFIMCTWKDLWEKINFLKFIFKRYKMHFLSIKIFFVTTIAKVFIGVQYLNTHWIFLYINLAKQQQQQHCIYNIFYKDNFSFVCYN